MIKIFSWNRYCPLCYRELTLGSFPFMGSHNNTEERLLPWSAFLNLFLGQTQQWISTLSMTKNVELFSSFLKTFLRNAEPITLCNLGVNLCYGISEECSEFYPVPLKPSQTLYVHHITQTAGHRGSPRRSSTQPGSPTALGEPRPRFLNWGESDVCARTCVCV